jgi:hypothetical protein
LKHCIFWSAVRCAYVNKCGHRSAVLHSATQQPSGSWADRIPHSASHYARRYPGARPPLQAAVRLNSVRPRCLISGAFNNFAST